MMSKMLSPTASGDEHVPMSVLRIQDAAYPEQLRSLPHAPAELFVAGSIDERDADAVAVVGSRDASPEALEAAFTIGRSLAEAGRTVVSGLARGIDTSAHRGALSSKKGRTIAVVATGLDLTFPPENADLDRLIRRRGAVVSRLGPSVPASRESLLARNELVAALSIASVIVVADERSGTRNEMGHALRQGKPVVFWEPSMGKARWARHFEHAGLGSFVASVDALLQRVGIDDGSRS
jgi:DNA processing protein